MTLVFEDHFLFHGNRDEWPSVRLVRAEAAIGSYLETPIVSSSPLASCQRKHVNASKNVASARINRTESSQRIVAIRVAANCGPTGMKPAETFLEPLETPEQKLLKSGASIETFVNAIKYGESPVTSSRFEGQEAILAVATPTSRHRHRSFVHECVRHCRLAKMRR